MSSSLINSVQENKDESEGKEKIKEILRSNGNMEPVSQVTIKDAGLKGEGFASLTQIATVEFVSPQVQPLSLFLKIVAPSQIETLEETKSFEKEATFFMSYVNAANDMCKRKGRNGFLDFYPKCYSGDEKMIVLENLVGYKTVSMDERQDLEEAKAGIVTLAKHYAISHVMIKECRGAKKFFEMFPNLDYEAYDKPIFTAMLEPLIDGTINPFINLLEGCSIPGASAAACKLKSFLGKGWGLILDALKYNENDRLLGLGHGDYWNNNMMFLRDKETNKIIHHVAIDFQVTRYGTAGIDLGYYLFTSVQPKVRQNKLHELLELFMNTFNSVTDEFGHPANLTFEEVFLDYRKKLGFGFWLGLTIAVGPVMAICKELEIADVDPNSWFKVLGELMGKWAHKNPDKTSEVAEELIGLMKEYDDMSIHE